MSEPAKAVFLSYAREDTDAAKRIADALRAFGIEVWLDQVELRGGDEWDAHIRRQIKECALFVPVISANTQNRREGYFRREWNLAVERTLDMAHGTPFLVPVVVDDTSEARALVPEQFKRVQWTRLPRGVPDEKFVGQLKRLLTAAIEPETVTGPPRHPVTTRRWPWWTWAAAVLALAGLTLTAWLMARDGGALQVDDHSLAVLPFTNLSDDRENTHFADGVHEDILTNLAPVRELRIVSRTSVMPYRNSQLKLREIAEHLNAAYILEGSVRGRGSRVRVTVQLIDARTDGHAWAKSYDRDLSDIFATQTELASEIATEIKGRLAQR